MTEVLRVLWAVFFVGLCCVGVYFAALAIVALVAIVTDKIRER